MNHDYSIGDLVRHKQYGYRGVVVGSDPRCVADDDWYYRNRSQPGRNQPWYHVLVDSAATTTYAAQCNLETDLAGEPVDHPLVEQFFDGFIEGRYQRNETVWNGW